MGIFDGELLTSLTLIAIATSASGHQLTRSQNETVAHGMHRSLQTQMMTVAQVFWLTYKRNKNALETWLPAHSLMVTKLLLQGMLQSHCSERSNPCIRSTSSSTIPIHAVHRSSSQVSIPKPFATCKQHLCQVCFENSNGCKPDSAG